MPSRKSLVACTIIARHGDRSPTFNAFEPLSLPAAAEASVWLSSLPSPSLLAQLDQRYPSDSHTKPRDDSLGRPFGSLTSLGLMQMRRLGKVVADLFPNSPTLSVRCSSSNFRRTQLSARCLLAGLAPKLPSQSSSPTTLSSSTHHLLNVWGTDPTLQRLIKANGLSDVVETSSEERAARELIIKSVPAFDFKLRPFSWLAALDHTMCREGKTGGGGPLRGRPVPAQLEELFSLPQGPSVPRSALKQSLARILLTPTSADLDSFLSSLPDTLTPAHLKSFVAQLRLPAPGSHILPGDLVEAAVVVERAVAKRFNAMLSNPKVGALASGPFARCLASGLESALINFKQNRIPECDVYAAHDVTLVPLLKQLKLWGASSSWPGLAAALLIKLHALPDGSNPSLTFGYFSGVRGDVSGLEPLPWHFAPLTPVLDSVAPDPLDPSVDLDRFCGWAQVQR